MQSRNATLGRIAGGRKHLVIYRRSRPSLLDGQRTAGGKEDGAIRPQQACAGNGIPSGAFDQVRAAQLGWDDAGLRGRSWHGDEPRRILRDRLLQTSTFVILSLRSPKRDGRRKNKQSEDGTRHLPKPFGAHSIPPHTAPCCAEPAMASRMCICSTIHVLLLLFAFAFAFCFEMPSPETPDLVTNRSLGLAWMELLPPRIREPFWRGPIEIEYPPAPSDEQETTLGLDRG